MAIHKNPTRPLRCGFDYQDLWTLKLCGNWLLNPDKYQWLQIEINPTEDRFFLDDIILFGTNKKYSIFQVKFKVDNNYPWEWNDFLESKTGKKGKILPSLIKKWATSFQNLTNANIENASLITNATFSKDIDKYLSNQQIDINKIKKENFTLYTKIQAEIGTEKQATEFFNKFRFIFENRSIDEIEKEIIEQLFCQKLYSTTDGVNKLLSKIKKEARKEFTIKLNLDVIREYCEFDKPRQLNENFEVPSDFEFFDKNTHTTLLKDLQNPEGGLRIITGKPGSGKSVYLSHLSEILQKEKIMLIKHHYHINPSENNIFDRLDADRVIEAIKAQFKCEAFKKYLGDLANKNSKEIPIKSFIFKTVKNLYKDKKNLVIIIDGLDHVTREKDIGELKKFLDEIFYPQKGVWYVLGTQPQIKNEPLLKSTFLKFTNEIEIKGLTKQGVLNIIKTNLIQLNLPDKKQFSGLIKKIYDLNKGHPLHLRYILKQLKKKFNKYLITEHSLNNLIPFDENINKYYASLWESLEQDIRSFLLTCISVDFQFTYDQFIECISTFDNVDTKISHRFNAVEHLIYFDLRQKIRIFHDSFKVFLQQQKEWTEQKLILKSKIKTWLEQSKYENLKWAELNKLHADLGNNIPILTLDRDWLIKAMAHPRNNSQISSQLECAFNVAMQTSNIPITIKIHNLKKYFEYANESIQEVSEQILVESLKLNTSFIDELFLQEIPSRVLPSIVQHLDEQDLFYIIDEVINLLQDRLNYQEYRVGEIPKSSDAIVKIIPYDRNHNVNKIFKYIIQFRDLKVSQYLFDSYSQKLLETNQNQKIIELLKLNLTHFEKITILENCVITNLRQKCSFFEEQIKKNKFNLGLIYLLLKGISLSSLPKLPAYDDFPDIIKEYGEERNVWSNKFKDYFKIGLIYSLSNQEDKLKSWINIKANNWPINATKYLLLASINIGKAIQNKKNLNYLDLTSELHNLENLNWPEDRERLEFKHAFTNALEDILDLLSLIKIYLGQSNTISKEEYFQLISTPFFKQYNIFKFVLKSNKSILDEEVFKIILNEKTQELKNSVVPFSERAEDYINLSSFCNVFNEKIKSADLILSATNNYLGYGYHKDIYLFDVLDAIDSCIKAKIDKEEIDNWIQKLIPIIDNITDCTDGDETNHLPTYLAELLSRYNPDLLYRFYFSLTQKEKLYSAQEKFGSIIDSLPFADELDIAIGSTSIDSINFKKLKEKKDLNSNANKSLEIISNYFGEIRYKEEHSNSSYPIEAEKIDYSKINPTNLQKHLKLFKTKWDSDNYLMGWIKHWCNSENEESIYKLIKDQILIDSILDDISGQLLDFLYPLAYKYDKENSFKVLCFAQKNNYGWNNKHYTSPKKAEERWEFLKNNFPTRYLEFYIHSFSKYSNISRIVDFFIYFKDISNAKNITEESVTFANELMADLKLDIPDWANQDYSKIDKLDLLFERLLWPSPLVREKTAIAIGNIIANSDQRITVYKRLMSWIKKYTSESIIAIGLLPITKAIKLKDESTDFSFIKINELSSIIKTNSVVIENLLNEIASGNNEHIKEYPSYGIVQEAPSEFKLSKFFIKYNKSILAPIYVDRALIIETNTGYPFMKTWEYVANMLAKSENIELQDNMNFYGHNKNGKFLIGSSTKVSEIYRSSFLRVLHDVFEKRLIPKDFYLQYSFATLPVDLSFWDIYINRVPEWWPKSIKESNKSDLSIPKLENPIKSLVNKSFGENTLIAVEGAICPTKGWIESPTDSFSIIGFGYKSTGTNLPTAQDISNKLLYLPQTILIPSKADNPLGFLYNSELLDVDFEPFKINDLTIFPIITRNRDLTINLWQYFRDKNQSFNVIKELRSNLNLIIKKNYWIYQDKNLDEKIIFKDFLEGLQERYEFGMPIPHGNFVQINKKLIMDKLHQKGLKLGYLIKITSRNRKMIYDELQKIDEYHLIL